MKKLSFILLFILIPIILFSCYPEWAVIFPDTNLEKVIREAISKPTGYIYESELLAITEIDASEEYITDISGMEYCKNLEYLDLSYNNISDINALENLTSLEYLDLSYNNISDINALENLTSLEYLWINNNGMTINFEKMNMNAIVIQTHLDNGCSVAYEYGNTVFGSPD